MFIELDGDEIEDLIKSIDVALDLSLPPNPQWSRLYDLKGRLLDSLYPASRG